MLYSILPVIRPVQPGPGLAMLLPIDLVEVIMVATIAIVGVIMWRAVTAPP